MSGVVTGSTRATMQSHLSGIHKDRKKAREKRRAEDPGGTISRSHDVRRVPASRRNSNTLIMAFGSSAVGRAGSHPEQPIEGAERRTRPLGMQGQQLLSQRQILQDEACPGPKHYRQPAE